MGGKKYFCQTKNAHKFKKKKKNSAVHQIVLVVTPNFSKL